MDFRKKASDISVRGFEFAVWLKPKMPSSTFWLAEPLPAYATFCLWERNRCVAQARVAREHACERRDEPEHVPISNGVMARSRHEHDAQKRAAHAKVVRARTARDPWVLFQNQGDPKRSIVRHPTVHDPRPLKRDRKSCAPS